MGRLKKTIIHAGAITGDTDHTVTASERGNRPFVKIDTAFKMTLTEGTPNTIVVQELTVVTDTPDAANEIQLVSETEIRVHTAHTASDLLVMHVIAGKIELP